MSLAPVVIIIGKVVSASVGNGASEILAPSDGTTRDVVLKLLSERQGSVSTVNVQLLITQEALVELVAGLRRAKNEVSL